MKSSAGILLYRKRTSGLEVMLVHPGGPYWKGKDAGAWSIPKGEIELGEDPLTVALREFKEETGYDIEGDFITLTPVKQKGGKRVYAFASEGDIEAATIQSNSVSITWPPGSGKTIQIPEVDQAQWLSIAAAKIKINLAQLSILIELVAFLANQEQSGK